MSGATKASGYDTKSAFQAFYFVIFGIAVIVTLDALTHSTNPAIEQLRSILPAAEFERASPFLNVLYWSFFSAFALHLLRIYVTLELMEEEYGSFSGFHMQYGKRGRIWDFIARFVIVSILTFEVIRVRDFDGFLGFVLYFYLALAFWGIIARFGGKKDFFGESFLLSSISGLLAIAAVMYGHKYWMILNSLAAAATAGLGFDLLFSKHNVFRYVRLFCQKWTTNW
jgi:hypothetical protein